MRTQHTLSRRQFLRRATTGTAALTAAPLFVPGHVLGANGATPPNSRITMALIGCGSMGSSDATQHQHTGLVQFVAFCDVDKARRDKKKQEFEKLYAAKAGKEKFAGIEVCNDFRELIARRDIDAVDIAMPDHWHAIPVIAAAKAGKDIYGQKPLSLTIREARAMVNAVRENKRVFQTGSQQRSDRRFRLASELVRNGYIGKIKEVYVRVGGPSRPCDLPAEPTPDGLDWNFWLGQAPERPFNQRIHPRAWRAWREYAGGGTTDWGAHQFDIVQWGWGMDESGPVEVIPANDKDRPLLAVRYASGALVYHVFGPAGESVKWPSPPEGDKNGITFVGEKGWIEVDRAHLRTFPESLAEVQFKPGETRLYESKHHYQNFLDCVKSRQKPICDVEIGCRSVTVCHLINIGHWTGKSFRWDPVKEEIIGEADVAKWVDRERRAPWKI